jgi:hypothetical protein
LFFLPPLAAGLLTGLVWARRNHHPYQPPGLRHLWLAPLALLPQFIGLYLPRIPDQLASAALLASQLLLLVFALLNRRIAGMNFLAAGLVCNLAVMAANGGFMPISPQAAALLAGEGALQDVPLGSRFGEKDILLLPQDTRLEPLADRFLTPAWSAYRAAFSLGDALLAAGAFWMLAKQDVHSTTKVTE